MTAGDNETAQDAAASTVSVAFLDDLISRAKTLGSELELFRARLKELRQEGTVELAHFRGTVRSELSMLERLSQQHEAIGSNHIARSSNLPFLEAVWTAAKQSKDIVALQKRIVLDSGSSSLIQGTRNLELGPRHKKPKGSGYDAVVVDTISDGGRTWTKVSLVTNTRLLFDLAKQGWRSDSSDSSDSSSAVGVERPGLSADDTLDVPLLKTAKDLAKAAGFFRVRTFKPTVRLVLPRIYEGEFEEVDKILIQCRKAGVNLVCGQQPLVKLSFQGSLHEMAPDPFDSFTETLNIDCTILLALVSDFSHTNVKSESWFHKGLQRQAEIELDESLLPSLLYPAMGHRSLVSTVEAVKRMREIVDTIGTPSEKARTAILFGDDISMQQSELIVAMQEWSVYDVPNKWQLPIRVVHHEDRAEGGNLSIEAEKVTARMTDINKSVFRYGWAKGMTTVTSNRVVVKQIEHGLEQFSELPDEIWPKLWLCPTARSLVGKEKRGTKKWGVAAVEAVNASFQKGSHSSSTELE